MEGTRTQMFHTAFIVIRVKHGIGPTKQQVAFAILQEVDTIRIGKSWSHLEGWNTFTSSFPSVQIKHLIQLMACGHAFSKEVLPYKVHKNMLCEKSPVGNRKLADVYRETQRGVELAIKN